MKIKGKPVRRNSSGCSLDEDQSVTGSPAVVTDSSVRSHPNDLGVGRSFFVGSGSQPNSMVDEGDHLEDFMDVDRGFALDRVWGHTPIRVTRGVVINEGGSSCEPSVNRGQRLPDPGAYVGKGKGKLNDAVRPSFQAAAGMSAVFCEVGSVARGAVTSSVDISLDIGAEQSNCPFTMPVGVPSGGSTSSSCHVSFLGGMASSADIPFPVNIENCHQATAQDNFFAVPVGFPPGCSVNASSVAVVQAHYPVTGSAAHVSVPVTPPSSVRRRQRQRSSVPARERSAPAGSAVPPRNVGGISVGMGADVGVEVG